jgi:4-cresol dehydrogenase (hydroxylating)
MSDINLSQLIERLREAIGHDNVVADEKQLEILSRTCIPYRELPSVIVYPTTAAQVQKVVLIAKDMNAPIWPVSTGKNWGYGEQTACYPSGITMILNRMTKIWHVDEKLGYAVIEPGVTYQMLNDHLKNNKIGLWADVSGSTQSGSVIGNALDKGRGVTPYADHFGSLCGMDVVLADGQILETGGGPQGNNHARHVYKWGLGPYLDGIFAQSNYGIVVKAGVWLMPQPEEFDWAVFEFTAGPETFGALVDDMRGLVFSGAMRARPHLANDFAMMCIVSQYPHELLNGKKCLSEDAMAVWRKKHGVARFTFGCGLYGTAEEVRFQRKHLRRVLSQYGMIQFLGAAVKDNLQGKILRWLAPTINRMMGKSASFTDALVPGINLFRGIPTDFFAKQVYFKSFKTKPSGDIIDPARDQCGFLWIGPLVPFISDHIEKAVSLSKAISAKYEFDYFLEVIIESPRAVIFLLGVFYDRNDPAESKRATDWYAETKETFLNNGYPAYRTTTMSMPHSLDKNVVTKNIFESIKKAVDPTNVIAPGRYGIMPHKE